MPSGREDPENGGGSQLNVAALAQQLRDRREGMSVRRAADEADVSFMTFARVEGGSQPDLATFLKLCAWLRLPPETFFVRGVRRDTDTLEAVTMHLIADPALDKAAANKIASMVRDMYSALARQEATPKAVSCHLRAKSVLRPGVADRLGSVLEDMHTRLAELVASGEL